MTTEFASVKSSTEGLPDDVQDRLARILDDYLVAAERGAPISPEELLERHPEDAKYLRVYLSGLQLFHAAAVASESSPQHAPAVCTLQPNQTVGDYRLLREIGRGGMGVVYEALQISLRRRVALKVLPFTGGHSAKQIGRFQNEAQAAAHVQHPNIVPVYAIGEENGVHYYAMQLIEGRSLSAMLAETNTSPGQSTAETTAPFCLRTTIGDKNAGHASHKVTSVASGSARTNNTASHAREVARLGVQAAEALHAAHEYGIVHRDVKPSNLLLDDQGKLWVTDFGLARCREHAGLTQTGDILGTMRYMSPEQALGRSGLIDHRTDIYSLGVTLYELATLHHPAGKVTDAQLLAGANCLQHKRLRHWNPQIPVDFETIVMKAIAEFPHERYATAQEFADDLRRFLAGKPILASPPSFVSRLGKWARRHRNVVYAAAAVLLLAIIGQSYNTLLLAQKNAEKDRALVAARDNLRQAHEVLDRFAMLGDQLAAIPGADGARYQLLEDSLALYERFESQAKAEPELAADLALAYSKIGSLNERMGKNGEALRKHLAARDAWEVQVGKEPSNPEFARNLALCHNSVGLLLSELGRDDEALAALEQAEGIQRELLTRDANSELVSTELATTCNNLGHVFRQCGRTSDAVKRFREAISLQERLVAQSPKNETVLRGLAVSYNNLGLLVAADQGEVAIDAYQKAIGIQKKLVEHYSINRIYQAELARTYNNLGYLLAQRKNWSHAELCYWDAVRLQKHLVTTSPLAASYRRDLAISYNNLGMAQSRDDRLDEAEASFRRAIELQQSLLSATHDDSTDARTLSSLGGVYNNLGLLLERQKRLSDADATYRQAIHFQRQALDASPNVKLYRELLENHYANYANCLRSQERPQAAELVVQQRNALLAGQQ